MNQTLLFITALFVLIFMSCQSTKKNNAERQNEVELVAENEGGNLAASKIRNLECPNYEICLIDYGCGKFNRKIHIMEQYP